MWDQWVFSFPTLEALPLDLGPAAAERRVLLPLSALALALLPPEERALLEALDALQDGREAQCGALCERALANGLRHPDFYLLGGAAALADGRCRVAKDLLSSAYLCKDGQGPHPGCGVSTRHLLPALRLLARIAPTQLVPLYPSPYAASLLYALALDACGEPEQALMILREMVGHFGMHDEVRIAAARIHLQLGNYDTAVGALTHADCAEQDALEYLRSYYLAFCLRELGQPRKAAQELGRAVRTIASVNGHSQARARLLLAELFANCGLLLDALRESGGVELRYLPGERAAEVLRFEEEVLQALTKLDGKELERLAEADPFQVYLPDLPAPKGMTSKLEVARDPLSASRSGSLSWIRNKEHGETIAAARVALAEGKEPPLQFVTQLSAAAADVQKRIRAAEEWWRERCPSLLAAPAQPQLALNDMSSAAQLRFDWRGTRELEYHPWQGELRAGQLLRWTGIILGIALALGLIRMIFSP